MTPFEFLNLSLAFWIVATIVGIVALIALLIVLVITAKRLGRSPIGWLFIGFFCSPIVATLILLLLETGRTGSREDTDNDGTGTENPDGNV